MKLLSNSGASTNLEFIAGASYSILERGYKPDVIDGNSSGALISPLLAMNRIEELKHLALNYTIDSAFNVKPNSIQAIWRAIRGKNSLGLMHNLHSTLLEVFTQSDFVHYKNNDKMPPVYIATVGYKSGKLFKTNLKELNSHKQAIKYIIASASIPIMSEYVNIFNEFHYDGGARTHTLAPYMQEMYHGNIDRHISIYSRPKDFRIIRDDLKKHIPSILERTIEIRTIELSKGNERAERKYRSNNNLSQKDMIFTPHLLKNKTYDFGNNQEKFDLGYNEALKIKI